MYKYLLEYERCNRWRNSTFAIKKLKKLVGGLCIEDMSYTKNKEVLESVTRKGYDLLNRMYISSQISKQTGEIINEIAKTEKLI